MGKAADEAGSAITFCQKIDLPETIADLKNQGHVIIGVQYRIEGDASVLSTPPSVVPKPPFKGFAKIARYNRECLVTEKIDGTNAQIYIPDLPEEFPSDAPFWVGKRSKWITPGKTDNFGFAQWAYDHADELLQLGPGHHFGEWWGQGIQRRYGLTEKRWSLFNVARWGDQRDRDKYPQDRPSCCSVVPVLFSGMFGDLGVRYLIEELVEFGSIAAPGFMKPEGVVILHLASGALLKVTCENDGVPKGLSSDALILF